MSEEKEVGEVLGEDIFRILVKVTRKVNADIDVIVEVQ